MIFELSTGFLLLVSIFLPSWGEVCNEGWSLGQHLCVTSRAGGLKCWGDNGSGQLGLGDTEHKGDDSSEMGDYLKKVFLGDNILVEHAWGAADHTVLDFFPFFLIFHLSFCSVSSSKPQET